VLLYHHECSDASTIAAGSCCSLWVCVVSCSCEAVVAPPQHRPGHRPAAGVQMMRWFLGGRYGQCAEQGVWHRWGTPAWSPQKFLEWLCSGRERGSGRTAGGWFTLGLLAGGLWCPLSAASQNGVLTGCSAAGNPTLCWTGCAVHLLLSHQSCAGWLASQLWYSLHFISHVAVAILLQQLVVGSTLQQVCMQGWWQLTGVEGS
jgi:hypothetical protein